MERGVYCLELPPLVRVARLTRSVRHFLGVPVWLHELYQLWTGRIAPPRPRFVPLRVLLDCRCRVHIGSKTFRPLTHSSQHHLIDAHELGVAFGCNSRTRSLVSTEMPLESSRRKQRLIRLAPSGAVLQPSSLEDLSERHGPDCSLAQSASSA